MHYNKQLSFIVQGLSGKPLKVKKV